MTDFAFEKKSKHDNKWKICMNHCLNDFFCMNLKFCKYYDWVCVISTHVKKVTSGGLGNEWKWFYDICISNICVMKYTILNKIENWMQ